MELYDGRESAYQWDTGLQIKIDNGTVGEEIHIGNVHSGRTCVVNAKASGNDIVADIPDELVQNSKGIAAYRMVTDTNGKYTRQEIIIPVIPRGKPDDYVYTPTEKFKWELLDGRITELEKKGAGGTADHSQLTNRDAADQHPIDAITGLQSALDGKQAKGDYLTKETDPTVPPWAKQPTKPTYTADEVGALPKTTVIPDVTGKEDSDNKVTTLSSSSTDTQYPSAKCVYEIVGNIKTLIDNL